MRAKYTFYFIFGISVTTKLMVFQQNCSVPSAQKNVALCATTNPLLYKHS